MAIVSQKGSLTLEFLEGDDQNPDTYSIYLTENDRVSGSLQVAAEWYELGGTKLNGSQVQTVRAWAAEYL